MLQYLKGRSGRAEYWASVGILIAVSVVLALLRVNGADVATTFIWLLIWSRRLHDINKPASWVLLPLGLILLVSIAAATYGGQDLLNAVKYAQLGTGAVSDKGAYALLGLIAAVLVVQGGFTIWLGIKRGDAGDNRFGPPPPAGFKS